MYSLPLFASHKRQRIPYTIAVTGSTTFTDDEYFQSVMDKICILHINEPILIISGESPGASALAREYAELNGFMYQGYTADWDTHVTAGQLNPAGFIRNQQMVNDCDECVAFWDNKSRNTYDVIQKCHNAHKPVKIVHLEL